MKRLLSAAKRMLITVGGLRTSFPLAMLGASLRVDYNFRGMIPERDYHVIMQLARDKTCFLDVGANQGIISLLVASTSSSAAIHAFEASEDAVNLINRNVVLNGFEGRVKVINALIADQSGKVIPFYWESSSGGASITKGRLGHTVEIFKCTLSLDDYTSNSGIKPDLIKMDIEGAENIAIPGMINTLRYARPDVFLELHSFGEKSLVQNADDILRFMALIDYKVIYLRTGQLIANAGVLEGRGRCHLLLQPAEKYSPGYIESLDLRGL